MKNKPINTAIVLVLVNTVIWYLVFIKNITRNLTGSNLHIPLFITIIVLSIPLLVLVLYKVNCNISPKLIKITSYVPSIFIFLPLKQLIIIELEKKYEGKNMETIVVSKSRVSTSILIVRLLFIIVSIAYFAVYSGVLFITYNMSIVFYKSDIFWFIIFIGILMGMAFLNAIYRTLLEIKLNKVNPWTIYRLVLLSRQGYNSDLTELISGKTDVTYSLE